MKEFGQRLLCRGNIHEWGSWGYESIHSCSQIRICKRSNCGKYTSQIMHTWGEWVYETATSCQLVKTCQRCGVEEKEKKIHEWGEWVYDIPKEPQQIYSLKLRHLHQSLSKRLNQEEMKELCFHLGVEYDDLVGETKKTKVIELLKHLERHHGVNNLVKELALLRPDISLEGSGLSGTAETEQFDIETLSWEFDPSETCTQVRVCNRCSEQEGREQHLWSKKLEYKSSTSCDVIKYCRRCSKDEWVKEEHQWSQWEYESPVSCILVRKCQHCHKQERKSKEEHQWGQLRRSNVTDRVEKVCSRCNKTQITISGIWLGQKSKGNRGLEEVWDLKLVQRGEALEGLLISAFIEEKGASQVMVFRQSITGEVDDFDISIHYSKSKCIRGQSNWAINWLASINDFNGILTADYKKISDKLPILSTPDFFWQVESGRWLDISGIWLVKSISNVEILYLKQTQNTVTGLLYYKTYISQRISTRTEPIIGDIQNNQLFLRWREGNVFSPFFQGMIIEDGKRIVGHLLISQNQIEEEVVFTLARDENE